MAEALLEHWGRERCRAYSAGSFPKGALCTPWRSIFSERLISIHEDCAAKAGTNSPNRAPEMDFVFTVCAQAASEVCPVWPGNPVTAHWGVPDPASVEGTQDEKNRAFRYAFQALETRIKLLTGLRLEALDRLAVKRKVDEIGHLRVIASEEPAP